MGPMRSMVKDAMSKGGPRLAMEKFLRTVAGDELFERGRGTALQERMMGNAEVLFGIELNAFGSYKPDLDGLAKARVPVTVAAGRETASRPGIAWIVEISSCLLARLEPGPGVSGGARRLLCQTKGVR